MVGKYYGIKFPFTKDADSPYVVDLNKDEDDRAASEILHVILTPKGSKLRDPQFGTDLTKYIFDENTSMTWDSIKNEVITAVSKFVRNVEIKDVNVYRDEYDEHTVILTLNYNVKIGSTIYNKELGIKL